MPYLSIKMVALLFWLAPPVWAIVVANARKSVDWQAIVVMAIVGPCATFATVMTSIVLLQGVPWWIMLLVAILPCSVYVGFSWGAVIWAHRGASECGLPRGFEVRLQSNDRR